MHRQVLPPASYGILCSKSAWVEGRRQTGLVQVAYRTWARCRSLVAPVMAHAAVNGLALTVAWFVVHRGHLA